MWRGAHAGGLHTQVECTRLLWENAHAGGARALSDRPPIGIPCALLWQKSEAKLAGHGGIGVADDGRLECRQHVLAVKGDICELWITYSRFESRLGSG